MARRGIRFDPSGFDMSGAMELLSKFAMMEMEKKQGASRIKALMEGAKGGSLGGMFPKGVSPQGEVSYGIYSPLEQKLMGELMPGLGGEGQAPAMGGGGAPATADMKAPATREKAAFPGWKTKGLKIGDFTLERVLAPDEKQLELQDRVTKEMQKEVIQGVSGEVGGRVALAKESIKNIEDVKKILFPTGEAKSFKRGIATGANIPGSQAPIIGPMIPDMLPWNKSMQDVHRKMGAIITGRQLIQTGVAARPEETVRLIAQFVPNFFSNPQAALKGLDELKEFYKIYLKEADPGTRFSTKFLEPSAKKESDPLKLR